jgi:hypothetical protein
MRWTPRHRRSVAGLVVGPLAFAGLSAPLHAEPAIEAVQLDYLLESGADRCPNEQALRAEVVRLLQTDPFQPEAPRTLVASIERQDDRLVARLTLSDAAGEILFRDGFSTRGPCRELALAMALSIAVHLDPLTTQPADAATKQAAPAPPQPPAPPPPEAPAAPAPPLSRRQPTGGSTKGAPPPSGPRPELALAPVITLGLTPGVAVGLTGAIGGRWADWSAALELRGVFSLRRELEGVPIDTAAFSSSAVGCLHRGPWFVCGLAGLDTLQSESTPRYEAQTETSTTAALGARCGGEWPWSERLSFSGYFEVSHLLTSIPLYVQDKSAALPRQTLWRAPGITAALGFGTILRF